MTDAVHQILEGEKKTVTALLDIIIADPRHKAVVVEEMVVVKARKFQKWGGMKITETPLLKDCLSHNKLTAGDRGRFTREKDIKDNNAKEAQD
eukprot:CAMPEP_0197522472 /NCGR_PEP_ID=MMETSP1318-20131121/7617_1 /TAXON_ID=552666 /ORGANISM="Partenskyella glossopodia, Strain RCC365" /LENGTH=92 /DNA_ID=CAMNT_0043074869 /DNA_START=316 /DNA_END=594 /DNA_ORIENTATION=+